MKSQGLRAKLQGLRSRFKEDCFWVIGVESSSLASQGYG